MMAVNLSFIGGAGWQFFDDNGNILIGGKIYTYAAGTTTPLATYTSRTGLVANANPIILDSSGRTPQQIWSTEGLLYKYVVKDSNDVTIRTWDNIGGSVVASDLAQDLAAPSGSSLVGFLPDGGVARTVQSKLRDVVSVKDFGAVGDGLTDDTIAIQAALNSGAARVYIPEGTYKTTAALAIPTQTIVYGDGKQSIISCTNGNVSQFTINGGTKCQVCDLSIVVTAAGTSAYVGGVKIYNSSNLCLVERVYFVGMSWAGVLISESDECQIHQCHFTSWQGTVHDSADVCIYNDSSSNIVANNRMYGGGNHGVLIQDPYAGLIPGHNIVSNNRIGQHTTYGVAIYIPGSSGSGDSGNQVLGNFIEDIQGSNPTNPDSGAGVYVVGNWAGATQVANNVIRNCCVHTSSRSLAPGGIGINGIQASVTAPTVIGNTVFEMATYDGIIVTSSPGGAQITGNCVYMPAGATGSAIRVEASSNVSVTSNTCVTSSNAIGVFVYDNGYAGTHLTVCNNQVRGGTSAQIKVFGSSGYKLSDITINGNTLTGSSSACVPLWIEYADKVVTSGNTLDGASEFILYTRSMTKARFSCNNIITSGTIAIDAAGTSTGSFLDKSNYIVGAVSNTATGFIIEQLGANAPVSGSWILGSQIVNNVPAVGQPKGWTCTVSGNPGTWVSQGNL